MNNKLKELTKEIQKANPSILEFNFGCNVEINVFTEKIWTIVVVDDRNLIVKPFGIDNVDVDLQTVDVKFITKTIGRPIQLEDVLIAIDKKRYSIGVHCNGEFIDIENGGKWHFPEEWEKLKEFPAWQFNKSLDNQSEETWDFLHNIICK